MICFLPFRSWLCNFCLHTKRKFKVTIDSSDFRLQGCLQSCPGDRRKQYGMTFAGLFPGEYFRINNYQINYDFAR